MNELESFGLTPRWQALFDSEAKPGDDLGRVIVQDRGWVTAVGAEGELRLNVRSRKTGPVVVGDWIVGDGEIVTTILERQSLLERQDAHDRAPVPLVANADLVLIVCGADRPRRTGRIERAVTQTWEANATPLIVLSKADMFEDAEVEIKDLQSVVPTTEIMTVSSHTGANIDHLLARIGRQTAVMVGESGAGKSALMNALVGSEIMLTGAVREADSKGKHTTTRRELHRLASGGCLIDTPGTRSLGLWAETESVDQTFPEIAELALNCRFTNCTHESEPDCAIKEALARGEITLERVNAWKALTEEAR